MTDLTLIFKQQTAQWAVFPRCWYFNDVIVTHLGLTLPLTNQFEWFH